MAFERENRYLVLKRTDIEAAKEKITAAQMETFDYVVQQIRANRHYGLKKQPLNCVVVESDWPEYKIVWKMIEERMEKAGT